MFELNEDSNFDSYHDNYDKSQEQEIGQEGGSMEENGFKIRNPEELKKSFYELKMDENDLYEMVINNDIALNLYQSLFKLKRGSDRRLFKYPCQIKVYPKVKIMVIYIIISHNFLRIKTFNNLRRKFQLNSLNSSYLFNNYSFSKLKRN